MHMQLTGQKESDNSVSQIAKELESPWQVSTHILIPHYHLSSADKSLAFKGKFELAQLHTIKCTKTQETLLDSKC